MKYLKKSMKYKGFTLVEMIVVIAIIGVLAAILVPSMIGYVTKAKFSAANSTAKTLYNAGMVACREQDVIKPIPPGVYSGVNGSGTYDEVICGHIYEYDSDVQDADWAIQIEEDVVTASFFRKDTGSVYFGTYPSANNYKRDDFSVEKALAFAKTGEWS